jgi:hypothetical protein
MQNTVLALSAVVLTAGTASAFVLSWYRIDRTRDTQRALNVLISAPKDVELQLFELSQLVSARAFDAQSASRALSQTWGISTKEASKLLHDALAV